MMASRCLICSKKNARTLPLRRTRFADPTMPPVAYDARDIDVVRVDNPTTPAAASACRSVRMAQ